MDGDLDGRVVIVTGGARGIGLGACECLAEAGAAVVVADIDEDAARASAARLEGAIAIGHDVRRAASSEALVERVMDELGRIDVLVNNAGVGPRPAPVQDTSEEEYDRVMDVNVRGVFLTTRAVVPVLLEQGAGRIINMSSVVGHRGRAMVLPYSASKHAIVGITQGLAEELAPTITVNSVHPGVVETELHSAVVPAFAEMQGTTVEGGWDWFRGQIPLDRFQTPRDIGEMVAFLASDRARNITGAAFSVDGGWSMH
jgi:NAD(P)-dependent dehydrogenase (short-subunit alcohol dehydrogenase family)